MKIKVGLLCGGVSSEHEISLLSAQSILNAIDKNKFEVSLIGIDKQGCWLEYPIEKGLVDVQDPRRVRLNRSRMGAPVNMLPQLTKDRPAVDVVFPILHGKNGEDGTVQGLLELAQIPYVGSGVLSSAICMDKAMTKRLLKEAGLPIVDFLVLRATDYRRKNFNFSAVAQRLGVPFFVKPANAGSSVGVHKVKDEGTFLTALEEAFEYDLKVLLESAALSTREIECSVLGNQDPQASLPGEIILNKNHEFYSYECKYLDPEGAQIEFPARLTPETVQEIQRLSMAAYKTLECAGMARVDFFLLPKGTLYINEVNTIPGFTAISMYPKLWEVSGLSYPALIESLIHLALEAHPPK